MEIMQIEDEASERKMDKNKNQQVKLICMVIFSISDKVEMYFLPFEFIFSEIKWSKMRR